MRSWQYYAIVHKIYHKIKDTSLHETLACLQIKENHEHITTSSTNNSPLPGCPAVGSPDSGVEHTPQQSALMQGVSAQERWPWLREHIFAWTACWQCDHWKQMYRISGPLKFYTRHSVAKCMLFVPMLLMKVFCNLKGHTQKKQKVKALKSLTCASVMIHEACGHIFHTWGCQSVPAHQHLGLVLLVYWHHFPLAVLQ